jgi:putative membrane protein
MSAQEAKSANELAEDRTDLAVVRTVMAADRSLMAWIRKALSARSPAGSRAWRRTSRD